MGVPVLLGVRAHAACRVSPSRAQAFSKVQVCVFFPPRSCFRDSLHNPLLPPSQAILGLGALGTSCFLSFTKLFFRGGFKFDLFGLIFLFYLTPIFLDDSETRVSKRRAIVERSLRFDTAFRNAGTPELLNAACFDIEESWGK